MPKFRKKPVVIDAVQWIGVNFQEVSDFIRITSKTDVEHPALNGDIPIITLEDGSSDSWTVKHVASKGDWIIRGVKDEVYACKDEIFRISYEPFDFPQNV